MRRKRRKSESGQAAVEFIAVVVVVFFFLFFYLSLAITLVVSNYVDYATFMAARTYKSGYSNEQFQERYATTIFNQYMDSISGVVRNPTLNFQTVGVDGTSRTAGVSSSYEVSFFYLPPIFAGDTGLSNNIVLESESFLGRDPSHDECRDFFRRFAEPFGVDLQGQERWMADNAC